MGRLDGISAERSIGAFVAAIRQSNPLAEITHSLKGSYPKRAGYFREPRSDADCRAHTGSDAGANTGTDGRADLCANIVQRRRGQCGFLRGVGGVRGVSEQCSVHGGQLRQKLWAVRRLDADPDDVRRRGFECSIVPGVGQC